jgi:hypothetical protein
LQSKIRIIKLMRMKRAGHVASMGAQRNACMALAGKPEGKRPLGRPRRKYVDNIKMDLREIVWGGMDWFDLSEGREKWRTLVNTVIKLRFP